jgi:hypothetical protein
MGAASTGGAAADARPVDSAPAAGMGGTGGGRAGPGQAPWAWWAMTACLNADGAGGKETYALIDSVLGANSVEHNPDMDHTPPFKHVGEDSDSEVGNHFVFYAHYPQDNDGAPATIARASRSR